MHETDKKNINPVLMKAGVVKRRCVLIPQTKGLQDICEVFGLLRFTQEGPFCYRTAVFKCQLWTYHCKGPESDGVKFERFADILVLIQAINMYLLCFVFLLSGLFQKGIKDS